MPPDPLWTAKQDSISLPGQVGLPGLRHSIGLARWWHLGVDLLWLVNGIVFYVLLFVTPQWQRLVPTSWSVFPDALSVLILLARGLSNKQIAERLVITPRAHPVPVAELAGREYLGGLQWPAADRLLRHRVRRRSPGADHRAGHVPRLVHRFKRLSKVLSIQVARSVHFLVLAYFLVFIVIHVSLVFATGLLVNLNHIYAGRTDHSWDGFWVFAVSMAVLIVAWVAATPFTIRHPRVVQRAGQAIAGPLQHLFEHVNPKPGEYGEKDISPYFWHNGQYPDSDEYKRLFDGHFAGWRLRIHGLVEHPADLSLAQLRALPHHEQITQHFCIQGWSGVAKWGGVSMQTIMDLVRPQPEAKWVVFYSLGEGADKGVYYDAHPIEHMGHHLTMLAYDMNGEPLSFGHGAPLRLRNENELGFKQVKWIKGIEFVTHYSEIGSGYGGYNEDHEFFGYRQSI